MGRKTLEFQIAERLGAMAVYKTKKTERKGTNAIVASYGTMDNYIRVGKQVGKAIYKEFGRLDLADIKTEHVQWYIDKLRSEGQSAETQNLACAAMCKVLQLPMSDIKRDKRHYTDITKGRTNEPAAPSNDVERGSAAIGVRRSELMHLRVQDIVSRPEGLCAHVLRGKGGKEQYQLILPHNEAIVLNAIVGKAPTDYIIEREDIGGKENIHAFRRINAREAYAYFDGQLAANGDIYRENIKHMCISRMVEFGVNPANNRDWKIIDRPYTSRPQNGTPSVTYNRLALMATSIFCLSHWRCGVAVRNYLT